MVAPEFLAKRADAELALGSFRVILLNALETISRTTDPATILDYEVLQSSGYQRAAFTYTPGSSTWNEGLNRQVAPDVTVSFSESGGGTGYQFNYGCLWFGGGATASKQCTVDPDNDRVTCAGHSVTNGDRVFIRSTGTKPTGLTTQRYYGKSIDANTLELYSDSALSIKADIQDQGVGTLYLQYANGCIVHPQAYPLATIAPGQSHSLIVRYRFGFSNG